MRKHNGRNVCARAKAFLAHVYTLWFKFKFYRKFSYEIQFEFKNLFRISSLAISVDKISGTNLLKWCTQKWHKQSMWLWLPPQRNEKKYGCRTTGQCHGRVYWKMCSNPKKSKKIQSYFKHILVTNATVY